MKVIEILFVTINFFMFLCALQLSGKCGYPGKPYKSKLDPDNKIYYLEGEEVTYQCLDYWSNTQTRKCVRGKWVGNVVRCAQNVHNTQLNYVKVEDITIPDKPAIMFEHINMTLIDTWNFPNIFVANRFHKRLRLRDTRKYRWTLKFTVPVVKLFTRIDFNFVNFTLLSADEQQKKNAFINISVDVGQYRKCIQDYQSGGEKWMDNGLRIDIFFTCNSLSLEAYNEDVKNPRNEIIFTTQSSINWTYDLTGIFFGRAFGSPHEPICGEPETPFGQKVRIIKQDVEYSVICADEKYWNYVSILNKDLPGTAIHKLKCIADMIWNGSYADCVPSKPCNFSELVIKNQSEVSSIENLYFFNNSQWHAVDGSQAYYGCVKNSDILVGKESRICLKNGSWTGIEPHCYNPAESNSKFPLSAIILILGICLISVITLTAIIFYFHAKRVKQKFTQQMNATQNQENIYNKYDGYSTDFERYDDIGVHSADGKTIYNDYDTVVEETEVRYADTYYPNQSNDEYCNISGDCTYLDMSSAPKPLPLPRRSIKKQSSVVIYRNEVTKM